MVNNNKNRSRVRWVISISIWTFFLALAVGFIANYSLNNIQSLAISFIILFIVVFLGIAFDLIGTAAAAADIAPLNAKAARRVPGARKAVYLIKNAEKVANFCNDVAGDISGIVSGTLAAIIVFKLLTRFEQDQFELYFSILLTALVAAITVGGKAWGKVLAINHSTEVILMAGLIISRISKPFGWLRKSGNNAG